MNNQLYRMKQQIVYVKNCLDDLIEKFEKLMIQNDKSFDNYFHQNSVQIQDNEFDCLNDHIFEFNQQTSSHPFERESSFRNQDFSQMKKAIILDKPIEIIRGGKYNKYPEMLKKYVINLVEYKKINPKIVSQILHIPLKNVQRWLDFGPIRKKGGGRKVRDIQMETKLREWVFAQKSKKRCISAKMIKKMAKMLISSNHRDNFKASKGWLEKFLKRNNITQLNTHQQNQNSFNNMNSSQEDMQIEIVSQSLEIPEFGKTEFIDFM